VTIQRRRIIELALTFAAPVVLLAIWETLARTETIDPRFWPAPSSLIDTTAEIIRDGSLFRNVRVSLGRILAGFLLGAIPAIGLGLTMGLFWPIRVFLMPLAAAIYAVPKLAIVPLVLIAFGTGEVAKYVIVALSIFFLVLLNTVAGVIAIESSFRDVARSFGAGPLSMFWTVALPGALPSIFTGLRLGMGFALVVIVGTEFIAARDGIGRFIWDSYQILAIKKMFVGLIVTGLMGWLLTLALDLIERLAIPWNHGH